MTQRKEILRIDIKHLNQCSSEMEKTAEEIQLEGDIAANKTWHAVPWKEVDITQRETSLTAEKSPHFQREKVAQEWKEVCSGVRKLVESSRKK